MSKVYVITRDPTTTSLSVAGADYTPDDNGRFLLPAPIAQDLVRTASHRFKIIGSPPAELPPATPIEAETGEKTDGADDKADDTPTGDDDTSDTRTDDQKAADALKAEADAKAKAEADAAPKNAEGLRLDGPTLEEYVKAGYLAENYPPQGYAVKE